MNLGAFVVSGTTYGPYTDTFTPATVRYFFLDGTDLTATPTNLLFSFGDTALGKVSWALPVPQTPTPGLTNEGSWLSLETGAYVGVLCCGSPGIGRGIVFEGTYFPEVNNGGVHDFGGVSASYSPGSDVIGVNETPLPAALPLFATGLGALGLLGWRRKRKAQAAA
jgi:hypothetical protein